MSSDISISGTTAAANDTFPEVAFFEFPNEASKSSNSRHKELMKHPAFRQISAINGEINKMNVKHLKIELEKLNFDGRGGKDVLKKRLKAYERSRILKEAGIDDPNTDQQHYTHIVVIDFEATCEEHQTKDYVHEIIEFPAVLVRVADAARVGEFHSLVRPVLNPVLSDFCRQLTGIDQSSVDAAPTFPEVLRNFENWLEEKGVGMVTSAATGLQTSPRTESALVPPDTHPSLGQDAGVSGSRGMGTFAVATDGPWDMARFLLMQCSVSELSFPSWARSWINLRKVFSNFYAVKRLCLSEMLAALGVEFEGRPHCGLDDARNIAVIAEALLRDGASPRVNETIAHLPHCAPPSLKGSSVANVTLKDFKSSQRRRHRSSCTSSSDLAEDVRGAAVSDKQTPCGDLSCDSHSRDARGTCDNHGREIDVGYNCDSREVGASCNSHGREVGVSCNSDSVGHGGGSGVGVMYVNGSDVSVDCSVSGKSDSSKPDVTDGGGGGDIEGSGQKDWMKKLCGEVCDLNVDLSNSVSQKLINGISDELPGNVVLNDLRRLEGSTGKAHDRTHSEPSNMPDEIQSDQCVVERSAVSPNIVYHNILYSSPADHGYTSVPQFNNSSTCYSDVSNRYPDTRCHTNSDGTGFSTDIKCDYGNSQFNPDHPKGYSNTRQAKNNPREPLPYADFHDRRYMHYTQLNNKVGKVGYRKDFSDTQGNSDPLVTSDVNNHSRKRTGGYSYGAPANGKPGRRWDNHRPSQYSSGSGEERYAQRGRRPPHLRRDGVHSADNRAAQGFYSNTTTNNESNTHKNIDFNDSTQFPVLGSLRRSYK